MLKRILSLILVLVMCLSLAACGSGKTPVNEGAAKQGGKQDNGNGETQKAVPEKETEKGEAPEAITEAENTEDSSFFEPEQIDHDALTWDFDADTGTLFIHGEGPMREYSSEAPEWEQYRDQILTVVVDDGITSIGAYAFYNYFSLTEVRLPDSVEVIDVSAFDYDWELRTITIPAALKYVGYRAFYNTLIWEPADLIFPEGCEYIGDCAFHSALKTGGTVSLPSTLKYLGDLSFTNAFISDYIVSEDNVYYRTENHAIYSKDGKEMLMLAPDTADVSEFRVPDGVERILSECFNVMHGIKTVYIPSTVTEIEEGAFFSTFDLKEIIVDDANPKYRSENGLLLSKDGTLLLAWPDGIECSELVIPDGVERLGEYLFYGRFGDGYTVVLPESLKEIGTMSLPHSMASLSLPGSLEKIDDNVFFNGIIAEDITYNGTAAEWEKITVGDGNIGLDRAAIHMN